MACLNQLCPLCLFLSCHMCLATFQNTQAPDTLPWISNDPNLSVPLCLTQNILSFMFPNREFCLSESNRHIISQVQAVLTQASLASTSHLHLTDGASRPWQSGFGASFLSSSNAEPSACNSQPHYRHTALADSRYFQRIC